MTTDPIAEFLAVLSHSQQVLAEVGDVVLADADELARRALLHFEIASLFEVDSELDATRRELVASVRRVSSRLDQVTMTVSPRRAA
jgi:hypothetical protein